MWSSKVKAQIDMLPFQPCPHGSQVHGVHALPQLPISCWSPRKRVPGCRHRKEPLSLKKILPRADAFTASAQDMKPLTQPSPQEFSTQMPQVQDVVIVGGGIAGLATALALHRVGVKPVLFEQSERLRTAGSTIGVWTNAWKALETLGVADKLREKFLSVSGLELIGQDGKVITSLMFNEGPRSVELRGVERKVLLETLREPLPDGTVFYDSRVVGIEKIHGGLLEVQCANGRKIQTKALIGCDGIGSIVGKYMNVGQTRYAGYTAIRGLAEYEAHDLGPKFVQIVGRGVRAGLFGIDANRVYWFVVFNAPDERLSDAELVREEAFNRVKGWPPFLIEVIKRSPLDSLSRRGISDRWMWPVGGSSLYSGGVTLAGDAMHPMTPNLGQGGCCALEDAVILARKLSQALSESNDSSSNGSLNDSSQEMERIELALKSYTEERWPRLLSMAARSYFTGALLQLDNELICSVRDKLIPKLITVERFIDHTFYDCGTLQWKDAQMQKQHL